MSLFLHEESDDSLAKMYFVTKWCSILFRYGVVTHYSGLNVRYATSDNFVC